MDDDGCVFLFLIWSRRKLFDPTEAILGFVPSPIQPSHVPNNTSVPRDGYSGQEVAFPIVLKADDGKIFQVELIHITSPFVRALKRRTSVIFVIKHKTS